MSIAWLNQSTEWKESAGCCQAHKPLSPTAVGWCMPSGCQAVDMTQVSNRQRHRRRQQQHYQLPFMYLTGEVPHSTPTSHPDSTTSPTAQSVLLPSSRAGSHRMDLRRGALGPNHGCLLHAVAAHPLG